MVSRECRKTKAEAKRVYHTITRNFHFEKKYGITLEEYNTMFEQQNGCCAICNIHQVELKRHLYVDHDHSTNKVRALLCHHCNSLLGYAKDNIEILQVAIAYLVMNKATAEESSTPAT